VINGFCIGSQSESISQLRYFGYTSDGMTMLQPTKIIKGLFRISSY
jgi:hypothetical protein